MRFLRGKTREISGRDLKRIPDTKRARLCARFRDQTSTIGAALLVWNHQRLHGIFVLYSIDFSRIAKLQDASGNQHADENRRMSTGLWIARTL